MTIIGFAISGMAAIAAGMINALAGGGTLITFPVLMAIGLPAVSANVTNTVALCPGYLGGTLAQAQDLKNQKNSIMDYSPCSSFRRIMGGILLLKTGEKLFTTLVPFLILLASTLLAIQNPVRAWIARRKKKGNQNQFRIMGFYPSLSWEPFMEDISGQV